MRRIRSLSILALASALTAGAVLVAPSASAGTASPSTVSIDCSTASGSTVTVSGAIGDTFTVTNTAASHAFNVCDLAQGSSYFSGMTAIPGQATEAYAITGYGSFPVVAYNGTVVTMTISAGSGSVREPGVGAPLPEELPVQSTAPTAVAGYSSAQVTWTPGANTGQLPTIRYVAFATDGTASCVVSSLDPSQVPNTCTVKGLTPGTSYSFVVQAYNEQGWGEQSARSNSVTPLPPAAPSEPGYLVMSTFYPSVIVEWDEPMSSGSSAVTHYEVQTAVCARQCADREGLAYGRSRTEPEHRVLLLAPPDGVLVARIRAVNEEGLTSPWAYGNEEMPGALLPDGLVGAFSDAQGSRVSWRPAIGDLRWLSYYAVAYEVDHSGKVELAGTTRGTSMTLPRIGAPGSQIRFQVTPVPLSIGDRAPYPSHWTPWLEQTDEVPGVDVEVARYYYETDELYVRWNQRGGRGEKNIRGYEVQYQRTGNSRWIDSGAFELGSPSRMLVRDSGGSRPATVRVRAVAWPGEHVSAWSYAGVYTPMRDTPG